MSSDSESNSFAKFWSSSDEDITEDDEDGVLFIYLFTNFAKDSLAGEISQNYCSNNETPKRRQS